MSLLVGKLEGEVEIKSSAKDFHDVFSCRPHHLTNISPGKIQGCGLHEGEFGKVGTIVNWDYVHDEKAKVVKELIEEINDETNTTIYKVLEGDLLDEFKEMRFVIKATDKEGGGSVVQWTLEYEKLNESIPDPKSLLDYVLHVSKDTDQHLQLNGKIEAEVEIKSSAEKFHDVFSCRPHHVSNITPEKIQGCSLHEGEFGEAGSTIVWDYVHEGKAKVLKEIIADIDDENNSITFKVIDGDLLEEYKDFIFIVQATPKEGGGSLVRWTLEYEKLHDNIPDPTTTLEFAVHITKDVDEHLQQS